MWNLYCFNNLRTVVRQTPETSDNCLSCVTSNASWPKQLPQQLFCLSQSKYLEMLTSLQKKYSTPDYSLNSIAAALSLIHKKLETISIRCYCFFWDLLYKKYFQALTVQNGKRWHWKINSYKIICHIIYLSKNVYVRTFFHC